MGNIILDYNQKTHKWIYEQTITPLYQDPKDKFEISATKMQALLTLVSIRLQMVGSVVLWIFGQGKNLCQCHGEYTLEQFKSKVMTFSGTHTREAQDDNTFATMLFNSITDAATAVMSGVTRMGASATSTSEKTP
jgi:hypothetical protein